MVRSYNFVYLFFFVALYRIVETAPIPRPQEAEIDLIGEGTETKETADVMSPENNVAMDTARGIAGDRDQAVDMEGIEVIASAFEEICTFLSQAKHLIVSG